MMKLLGLVFLVGFVAAYPYAAPEKNEEDALLSFLSDVGKASLQEALSMPYAEEFDETEDGDNVDKLKEKLHGLLEKINEGIEKGTSVSEDIFTKAMEIKKKLDEMKVDLGEKTKKLLENIKQKIRDFFRKIWGLRNYELAEDEVLSMVFNEEFDENEDSDSVDKMKEKLDGLLEKIKDGLDKGKLVGKELFEKAKEIRKKLKEMKVDLGEKAKELFENIKEKVTDFFRRILDKIGNQELAEDEVLSMAFNVELDENEDDDSADTLKERLNGLLERIKEKIEEGKIVGRKVFEKVKQLLQKLKEKKVDVGEKLKELLKQIRVSLKKLVEKLLGGKDTEFSDVYEEGIDVTAFFRGLAEKIKDESSVEEIVAYIRQRIGGTPLAGALIQIVELKGRETLRTLVESFLRLTRDRRDLKERLQKIKDFFEDFRIKVTEKVTSFLEWAKESLGSTLDKTKDKIENVKAIARKFIDKAKDAKKEVAEQALEFFREYKEQLGSLWEEVKKSAKEVIGH